ncbi:hypothetical protein [Lacinutrix salivirga]
MKNKDIKKYIVLSILFVLPVVFLIMLYPAKHNYNTLEVVKENVLDFENLNSNTNSQITLKNHLSVVAFFGNNPEENIIPASNLKEMVYDKFKGFKKFQLLVVTPLEAKEEAKRLKQELAKYSELKYWHFVYLNANDIKRLHNSFSTREDLDANFATHQVYIIDKELNQRGRLDDRTKMEIEAGMLAYPLVAYNCNKVAILKNKMSDDMRVLFQEVREKRKGNFDSNSRRANDLKNNNNE